MVILGFLHTGNQPWWQWLNLNPPTSTETGLTRIKTHSTFYRWHWQINISEQSKHTVDNLDLKSISLHLKGFWQVTFCNQSHVNLLSDRIDIWLNSNQKHTVSLFGVPRYWNNIESNIKRKSGSFTHTTKKEEPLILLFLPIKRENPDKQRRSHLREVSRK